MTVSFPPGTDAPVVCEALFQDFNTDPCVEDKNVTVSNSHIPAA